MKKKVLSLIILSGLIISMSGCTAIKISDSTTAPETNVIEQTTSAGEQAQQETSSQATDATTAEETTTQASLSFDSASELTELNTFLEKESLLGATLMYDESKTGVFYTYESLQNKDGSYIGKDVFASGKARYTFAAKHFDKYSEQPPVCVADIDEGSDYGSIYPMCFVSYDEFNKVYKKYFNTDYDISTGLTITEYDQDYYDNSQQAQDYTAQNYVLLNDYFDGMNGIYLINTANAVSYDESTGIYTATLDTALNDRDTEISAFTSELKYSKDGGNIILKSYTITANK